MNYIKIKNNGLIEPQALHLVGASTKRSDTTKIGQFGSGNKYALAYFLRNGYEIRIFAGMDEIKIETRPEAYRSQAFEILYINNERTSITTEMGKDWQLWQAMREIYCNAIDEGGYLMEFVEEISPADNETHFYIENKEAAKSFTDNFDNYFAHNKEILFECEAGRILKKSGETANIYRKGIRCFETNKTSVFDYDFNEIEIDENRLIKYFWKIEEKIWQLIYQCTNKDVIVEALQNSGNAESLEGTVSDYSTISPVVSSQFKEVINGAEIAPASFKDYDEERDHDDSYSRGDISDHFAAPPIRQEIFLPPKIYKSIRRNVEAADPGGDYHINADGSLYRFIEPNEEQLDKIFAGINFFKSCGQSLGYPVKLAKFDKRNVLGSAHNDTILISAEALENGLFDLCITLLEEDLHLSIGAPDESREFQTAILGEYVSYMAGQNRIRIHE